jgi:hypothetical protein
MTDADVEEKLIVVTAPRARGALDDSVARLINDGLAMYEQVGAYGTLCGRAMF